MTIDSTNNTMGNVDAESAAAASDLLFIGDNPVVHGVVRENSDKAAARQDKHREKSQKQIEFIQKCSIEDVLVDESRPVRVGRNEEDTTYLQLIKGVYSRRKGFEKKVRFGRTDVRTL